MTSPFLKTLHLWKKNVRFSRVVNPLRVLNYDLSALLNKGELLNTIFYRRKTSVKFKFFCILLVTCATLKQANLAFPTSNDGQISSTTC